MSAVEDILIIGAGPAGTSAALALADAGLRPRLVDAGEAQVQLPPRGNYLELRARDREQWRWQVGGRFEGMRATSGNSPKLRVPGMQDVFAGYAQANRLRAEGDFQLVGALCAGGLSNAWGCGVAAFDARELAPLDAGELQSMQQGYARCAQRMGLSGAVADELEDFLGVDRWSAPPLPLDGTHAALHSRHVPRRVAGFRLGRARVAVLSQADDNPARSPCDLSGLCLFGCPQRATWSAALDLERLGRSGIALDAGVRAQALAREDGHWRVDCVVAGESRQYRARRVLLAAGTIASSRLAMAALATPPAELRLQSNPMAAFLALLPRRLGAAYARGFGLAQLSFAVDSGHAAGAAFGNLFSTAGLPVSEFLPYLPVTRRAGIPLLRTLLPACVVGNVFLPGALSGHRLRLDRDGAMQVLGGASPELPAQLAAVRAILGAGLRGAGAWMLPGSFAPGQPGADLHYAATLPMRRSPQAHECHTSGEIAGLPGVYAIDGASLPSLPAKAHTLTLMANADRIARGLAA